MAIIALIVTPLVMSMIKKARVSADKRSIDAYGRSIELAIAGYLLDNGSFPTSIDQLTIVYSGNEVICENTQINPDSSVYLAGCKVNNREVSNYTYGSDKSPTYTAYEVGDEITYNNVDYYVIKDSGVKESTVILLKAEPLTTEEVNQYGAGHVNRYANGSVGTAFDNNGYGGMQYYSSETCGYVNNNWVETGCKNDYASSEIKYVVDAWKAAKAPAATEARLITYEELVDNFGYTGSSSLLQPNEFVPNFVYDSKYAYWTMSANNNSNHHVWFVSHNGWVEISRKYTGEDYGIIEYRSTTYDGRRSYEYSRSVRPVVVLSKSVLQ